MNFLRLNEWDVFRYFPDFRATGKKGFETEPTRRFYKNLHKKKKKSDKKIISELGFSSKMDPPNFFIHCSEKLPHVLEKNVIFF